MNQTQRKIIALLLAIIMVAGAGCAGLGPGWGEDGPADSTENDDDANANGNPLVCGYATDVAHSQQAADTTECPTESESESESDSDGDERSDDDTETHSVTITLRSSGQDSEPLTDVDVTVVAHDSNGGERVATGTTDENGEVTFDLPRGGYELVVDHETTDHVALGTFLFGVDGEDDDVQFVLSPPIEDPAADDADTDTEGDADAEDEKEQKEKTDEKDKKEKKEQKEQKDQKEKKEQKDEKEPKEPDEPDEPEQPDDDESEPEQPDEGDGDDDADEPETHTVTVYAGEAVPVEGVEVTITGTDENSQIERTLTTDESGQVEFDVPDGEYQVTGVDPRGDEQTTTVTVAGEDTSVMLGQMDGPEPPIRSITFEVVDAETGEPIEGAVISGIGERLPSGAEALLLADTGADGTATVEVFESSYDLDIQAVGYETRYQSITVDEEMTVTIELTPEEPEPEPEPEPEQPAEPSVNESGNQTTAAVAV